MRSSLDDLYENLYQAISERNEPKIRSLSKQITQLFENLLNNAIKYTDEGFVEFGYIEEDSFLKFFVKQRQLNLLQHLNMKNGFQQDRVANNHLSYQYTHQKLGIYPRY